LCAHNLQTIFSCAAWSWSSITTGNIYYFLWILHMNSAYYYISCCLAVLIPVIFDS